MSGGVHATGGLYATQGMIGAADFVQPGGDLTPVSFRFLASMFQAIQQLQTAAATLQTQVNTLQARLPPP